MTNLQRPCSNEYAVTCGSTPARSGQPIVLSSPAKLNIFLEVLGKRPDGYHELETVMVRTKFCDQLTFQRTSSPDITLSLSDATSPDIRATMPLDERNLIVKAALALQRDALLAASRDSARKPVGARIILHKRIPPESGLGGGSSNAATTLLGCRKLWDLDVSDSHLHSIAASLGSDINFLLSGAAAAVCRGRGEIIQPIKLAKEMFFVAFRPRTGNSTPAVFRQTIMADKPRSSAELVRAVLQGTGNLSSLIFNRLTDAASQLNPEMQTLLNRIPQIIRRPAFMSGSGSTVYVIAAGRRDAKEVASRLTKTFRLAVWLLECGMECPKSPQSK